MTAMLTDHYELTMLSAALADGTAHRPATFALFARRTPDDRPVAHVGGIGRALELLDDFTFDGDELDQLVATGVLTAADARWLAGWRFSGHIDVYPEGELYGPNSPVMTVRGTFADTLLETMLLSVVNHDSAVLTSASQIIAAAGGVPVLEMGSRRTHERAAVAAARACWIGGFAATSNLAAGHTHGIPTMGTAAHAWTLAHGGPDGEPAAFDTQLARLGPDTTLLVDTFETARGIDRAVDAARRAGLAGPGGIRIDSGDLAVEAHAARAQLDALGATDTRIVVSGDLDADRIGRLRRAGAPIDAYGVGTRAVAGLAPPGFVYKLVDIDVGDGPVPVGKTSAGKHTVKGRRIPFRPTDRKWDVAAEQLLEPDEARDPDRTAGLSPVQVPAVRHGEIVYDRSNTYARTLVAQRRDAHRNAPAAAAAA